MESAQELLDRPVIDELRRAVSGEVFQEIGETFSEQVEILIERLNNAAAARDIQALERHAHELTGAAGTFGANRLAACAHDVMQFSRNGSLADALSLIPGLSETGLQTLDAFSTYCDGSS